MERSSEKCSSSRSGSSNCGIVYVRGLPSLADMNPGCRGRYRLLYALLRAYGLIEGRHALSPQTIGAEPSSDEQIAQFHMSDYINALFDTNADEDDDRNTEFGLEHDCPKFKHMQLYVRMIAGSTLAGVDALLRGDVSIAVNWVGGRHHASPSSASGFCFVNDAVLALLRLSSRYDRVGYVDLDVHHGDGVADAFAHTASVLTLSIHHRSKGFFPTTGAINEIGAGEGLFHTLNVPLKEFASDATLDRVFASVWPMLVRAFDPEAVVLQLGVDGLAGDPLGAFQYSTIGLSRCLARVRAWCLRLSRPLLVLGGGGYRPVEFARSCTYLSGVAAGVKLPDHIPEHSLLREYGPSFTLMPAFIPTMKDANSTEYLDAVLERCRRLLRQVEMRRLRTINQATENHQ